MFSIDPRGGHNRYKFKTEFFEKWSPDMAYVLGFLYADGDIEDTRVSSRTQYITFASKDKDILESIRVAIGSEHNINCKSHHRFVSPNGKTYECADFYRLRIGSKKMFDDLLKLGLTPRKSLTIKFPDDIPNDCFYHFVRGYFDGDGCITIKRGTGKYGQRILKGLAVIFTSGSKDFLEGLSRKAHEVGGFEKKEVYDSLKYSRAYSLRYATVSESLKWFKFFYNKNNSDLFLRRKFDIFKKYFQLRPSRIEGEILNILDKYDKYRPSIQVV